MTRCGKSCVGFSKTTDRDTSHGDYEGVAFHDRIAYMVWADNSNSALDNPDPDCGERSPCMDVYVPEPGSSLQLLAGIAALLAIGTLRSRA